MAGIYKRVWAVIRVLDECTGKPVERSSVRMTLPMGIETVTKEGGMFLITKTAREDAETLVPEEGCRVGFSITGPCYEPYEGDIMISPKEHGYTVTSISLVPSVLTPPAKGITVLEGTAEPGSSIFAACLDEKKLIKPVEVLQDTQKIHVYRQDRNELAGRYVAVIQDDGIEDILSITEEADDNVMFFSKPLSLKSNKKQLPDMYLINRAVAGEDGYFRILIPGISKSTCRCAVKIQMPGGNEKNETVEIKRGERNKLTI